MSLGKAMRFLKRVKTDKEFRKECVRIPTKNDLMVKEDFTEVEFEDAINMALVKCQTYEEADVVKQLQVWFRLL